MITIKDVEHVAKLARLELTEDEKDMVKIVGSIKVGAGVTKPGYFAKIAVADES